MALPDLTGQNIENTYQRVIQTDGTNFYDGTGSLVNFGGAVFPYTGSAIISGSLIVTGSTDIQYLTASGLNYPDTDGTEFMVLRTDGNGNLSFDYSDRTSIEVRTIEAVTKGDPLRVVGFNNGQNRAEVRRADALNPSLMPSYGLAYETVGANVNTQMVALGALDNVNTQIAPNDFQEGDILYVQVGGGLTNVKPTGSALIQNVGKVARRQQNSGEILVSAIGRSNDIPNIQPGYAWVGNENWVATAVPTSSFNEDPFPYTGSAAISGSLEVTGDVTIYGTASVNVLITNYESSSIIYSSGSTKFGDSLDDTHIFTGSVSVEGGITTTDNITIPRGKSLIFPNHPTQAGGISIGDNFSTSSPGTNFVRIGNSAGTEALSNKFIAIGDEAGRSATGQQQIFIGFRAGRGFDNSNNVVVIGHFAAWGDYSNADVDNAVILGTNAGQAVTQTDNVVIIGTNAGYNTEYSSKSVIIGDQAGYNHSGSSGDAKEGNVFIGYQAGYNELGSNKLIIANTGSKALVTGDFTNNTFNISGSVSASTYYGDGSNLTGIETDPFPYTGSAVISGSLIVTGSVSSTDTVIAVTGSFSHLKGNSPITVQDPTTFQQTLSVLGNATLSSINEVDIQTISKDFNYTSSLNVAEITASVNGAIIDYRLTNLNSGSRVGTFMYAHDGTTLSYNDLTIPGGGIGSQPILSATLTGSIVSIDIENAQGFNFTGYAKKFNRLDSPVPIPNPNATYPLDTYTGAAVAFSTRQLSDPNIGYTGSCMRVREDGSNTEADINFGVDGLLDAVALASHCGSNNGYVVTWYDQSGNGNDASNSTLTRQPKIYDGSTGILKNSNNIPYVQTNATNGTSDSHLVISSTAFGSVYWAGLKANSDDTISSLAWGLPGGGNRVQVQGTNFFFSDVNLESQDVILGGIISGSNSRVTVNNEIATGSVASIPNQNKILGRGDGSRGLIKTYELMVWNSAQTIATDEGLREDMNNHYNFYDTGLLAEYPGAVTAYSVRLLDSAYTGSALRIREDGTNTETDIGFDSNGDLDTTSITSHCGSNNGLVVTWYDQSGNGNDATQATTTNQPKIYDGTTGVVTENGKPIINLVSGNSCTLLLNTAITSSTTHIFGVAELDKTDNKVMIGVTNGGGKFIALNGNTSTAAVGSSLYINGTASSITTRDEVSDQFQNQTSFNSIQDLSSADQTRIGMLNGGGDSYKMFNMQEIIFYTTDQSSNRTGIEDNINSYFNIYS